MKLVYAPIFLIFCLSGQAQPNAVVVLRRTEAVLSGHKAISYHYTREIRYYENNYHHQDTAGIYVENDETSPVGLRFRGENRQGVSIFNGKQTLYADKAAMTIDSQTISSSRQMESSSYLFHSLAALQHLIPIVLGNDSIVKTVVDTTIGNETFFCVMMEGAGMYFDVFNSVSHFTDPGLRRPYYLIVDKRTFLPRSLVAKYVRGSDDRDFIETRYGAIDLAPPPPAAAQWNYASWAGQYKPYVRPVKIPLVKPGTRIPDFTLPGLTDSVSLRQYAGKVRLLEFWFKSCGPCMEAMPHYNELQEQFKGRGFELLTINIEDPVKDIQFFYDKYQPRYPMLYKGGEIFKSLGFSGCPSSVLLDQDGKVIATFFGFDKEKIVDSIQSALTKGTSSRSFSLRR